MILYSRKYIKSTSEYRILSSNKSFSVEYLSKQQRERERERDAQCNSFNAEVVDETKEHFGSTFTSDRGEELSFGFCQMSFASDSDVERQSKVEIFGTFLAATDQFIHSPISFSILYFKK